MGNERKRGKLADLNASAARRAQTRFSRRSSATRRPARGVRYVITLDTDTQLPRDAARQLVGTIAHPLNRPRFDPERGAWCEGYGILQPRVGDSMPSAGARWFCALFGSEPGIDPYTRAVSDVYQDLFGEGSFIGKGIYDVDAFEAALAGRFPENRILSHDLLEGCYARVGAGQRRRSCYERLSARATAPTSAGATAGSAATGRSAAVAAAAGPRAGEAAQRNPLSALSRGRYSTTCGAAWCPPALTRCSCSAGHSAAGPVLDAAGSWPSSLFRALIARWSPTWSVAQTADAAAGRTCARCRASIGRSSRAPCCASPACPTKPASAWTRSCARYAMLVTHRQMLEWTTSGEVDDARRNTLSGSLRAMGFAPLAALATLLLLCTSRPEALWPATPLLLLWVFAPL